MVRCFFEKNDENNNCQKYLDIQGSTFDPHNFSVSGGQFVLFFRWEFPFLKIRHPLSDWMKSANVG